MASIDRADWHYGGDFPSDLPIENGGTHIGMFLNWIIDNNLIGALHLEHSIKGINDIKARKKTGRDFLFEHCDGKFWAEDLNEKGINFTNSYYQDSSGSYGQYLTDYENILLEDLDSLYRIEDSFENYNKIARKIDEAYTIWNT